MGEGHPQGTSLILSLALARWQKYSVCFCPGDPLVTSTSNLERLPHIPLSFLPVAITNSTQSFYQLVSALLLYLYVASENWAADRDGFVRGKPVDVIPL
jgi:hypothetical protein